MVSLVVPRVQLWNVIALDTPRVLRRCARCDVERPFASSDRFRVNAQKRRLDVWLVYKCPVCEDTWNLTVASRRTPAELGLRLDGYHANDRALAWACAFDRALHAGARVERRVPLRVERPPVEAQPLVIQLALPHPLGVRLDRLLATELGVPRASLQVDDPAALRREIVDGQRVTVG